MKIPIENVYYLLLYAWDVLEESELVRIGTEPLTRLSDLYARILTGGVEHLLRRGLDRGYQHRREALAGPRGKFDLSASLKSNSFVRGTILCEFDEQTYDVPHNRILRATLRRLLAAPELNRALHERVKKLYRELREVADVPLTDAAFRTVQLHRNIGIYRFLLSVCRLVHDTALVNEFEGTVTFRDFIRDRRMMAYVFQKFVRNFYAREQNVYKVTAEAFEWQDTTGTLLALRRLPRMETDASLSQPNRRIAVETKFYGSCFQRRHGKATLRSSHLYQLFAYLQNLSARNPAERVDGLLLYPAVSRRVKLNYEMHGHRVCVRSVDLRQTWQRIRADLLTMVDV